MLVKYRKKLCEYLGKMCSRCYNRNFLAIQQYFEVAYFNRSIFRAMLEFLCCQLAPFQMLQCFSDVFISLKCIVALG